MHAERAERSRDSERSKVSYGRVRRSRSWSSSDSSPKKKRQRTSPRRVRSRRSGSTRRRSPGKDYSRRPYSRGRSSSISSSPRRYARRSKHSRRSKSNSQRSRSPKKASRSPKTGSRSPKKKESRSPKKSTSKSPRKAKVKVEEEAYIGLVDLQSASKMEKRLKSGSEEKEPHPRVTKKEKLSPRAAKEEKEPESDNDRNRDDSDSDSSSSSSGSSSSSDSSDSSDSESNSQQKGSKGTSKELSLGLSKDAMRPRTAEENKTRECKGEESGEEDGEIDSNELYTTKSEYHRRKKGHLFCAGFPLTFRSIDLMEFFQDFGAFDAKIVERAGKRFGFVDFISEERAELARFALNGKRPAGEKFPIFVTEKTERGSVSHWVRETEAGGPRFKRGRGRRF